MRCELDGVEQWWSGDCLDVPFPGRMAFFVGAGISIAGPTYLPDGKSLTVALVNHLLGKSAAEEILSTFKKCSEVIGRDTPRLEHVLDIACKSEVTGGADPKSLLSLFANRSYNSNHRHLAAFLAEKKSWVITTNFDDCIERAYFDNYGCELPVHVVCPESGAIDSGQSLGHQPWGLVKLHGSITQGVSGLGATLSNLVPGLHPELRNLLSRIFQTIDLLVVAGYSGSDHFDVNAWFRERMGASDRPPRLLWINHSSKTNDELEWDDSREPGRSWHLAMSGSRIVSGHTDRFLCDLMGVTSGYSEEDSSIEAALPLAKALEMLYCPSEEQRYRNGAQMAIAIGLGQLAEEELRRLKRSNPNSPTYNDLIPQALSRMGMYHEALRAYRVLGTRNASATRLARASVLRCQGRTFRAIATLIASGPNDEKEDFYFLKRRLELAKCCLDVVDGLQGYRVFRGKIFKSIVDKAASAFLSRLKDGCPTNPLPLSIEGELELIGIRLEALVDEVENGSREPLWMLLDEQKCYPDVYTMKGPVFPGYYLSALQTSLEEDRLIDVIEINLLFAKALAVLFRRYFPRGVTPGEKVSLNWAPYVEVCWDAISRAEQLASALDVPHVVVAVSRMRMWVDKTLGGFHYCQRQRLYLP